MQQGNETNAHDTDVLVVGGGYAGLWAALSAARQRARLGSQLVSRMGARLRIALLAPSPHLTARPRLYEANLAADDACIDFLPALRTVGVDFIAGEAVDVAGHCVVLANGTRVHARALVLATGSLATPRDIPGLSEHAEDADTAPAAQRLWRRVRALPANGAVLVLGGGFTGIELACELASDARATGRALQVCIVDRARVAAGYSETARNAILGALRSLGVQWREHANVLAYVATGAPGGARLATGETLPCDVPVWAAGLVPSPLAACVAQRLAVPRAADGRLEVLPTLQLPGAAHWLAAGDVAAARADGGHLTTFSCQHAMSLGAAAGHNAVNLLAGEPCIPFLPPFPYVTCLDLGAAGAIVTRGFARELEAVGADTKPTKRYINEQLIVPPVHGDADALFAVAQPHEEGNVSGSAPSSAPGSGE